MKKMNPLFKPTSYRIHIEKGLANYFEKDAFLVYISVKRVLSLIKYHCKVGFFFRHSAFVFH